jgi:hypothetical protein
MTQTPTEPGYFDQFRQSLIPQYNSMMRKAQQPIYGDAQKAQVINDANNIFNTGIGGLRSSMAAGGRLRSGAMESAGMGMGISRAGGISNFFSQLPANEQAAQWNKMSPLLQAGMGWAGRAPVGQTTQGTNTTQSTMNGVSTNYGTPFLQNLAYGIGGMAAGGGLNGIFGGQNNSNNNGWMNLPTYNGWGWNGQNPASGQVGATPPFQSSVGFDNSSRYWET